MGTGENLLEWINIFSEGLDVKVAGSPPINVLYFEFGHKAPEDVGVEGPTQRICNHALAARPHYEPADFRERLGQANRLTSTNKLVSARSLLCQNRSSMSNPEHSDATTPWGSELYGNPCRECNFGWDVSAANAVTLVERLPRLYVARLKAATGNETYRDLAWSVSAYVSHVSDNLRIWGERLAGARLSNDSRVTGYEMICSVSHGATTKSISAQRSGRLIGLCRSGHNRSGPHSTLVPSFNTPNAVHKVPKMSHGITLMTQATICGTSDGFLLRTIKCAQKPF